MVSDNGVSHRPKQNGGHTKRTTIYIIHLLSATGSLVMSHIGNVYQPLRDFTGSQTGSIWRRPCMASTAHVHIHINHK